MSGTPTTPDLVAIAQQFTTSLIDSSIERVQHEYEEEAAAGVIQGAMRKHHHEQRAREERHRQMEEEHDAAVTIQRHFRGYHTRRLWDEEEERFRTGEGPREALFTPDPTAERAQPTKPRTVSDFTLEMENCMIDIYDRRTEAQKENGLCLVEKFWSKGEPYFSSPLNAKAFLQSSHEFDKREANIRHAIEKQVVLHRSYFSKIFRYLHQLSVKDEEARHSQEVWERRYRSLVQEEQEMHWAALIHLWFALMHGDQWAEMYSQLCAETHLVEDQFRSSIKKDESSARVKLAALEHRELERIKYPVFKTKRKGNRPESRGMNSMQEALEHSRQSYGFSANYSVSNVNLKARRSLLRLQTESQNAERAEDVRYENYKLQSKLDRDKVEALSSNFAKAVKQRDETKARRKKWRLERDQHFEHLREEAKQDQLASRRTVHEGRNPQERNVFRRLLTPIASNRGDKSNVTAERVDFLGGSDLPREELFSSIASKSPFRNIPRGSIVQRELFDPSKAYGFARPISRESHISHGTQTAQHQQRTPSLTSSQAREQLHKLGPKEVPTTKKAAPVGVLSSSIQKHYSGPLNSIEKRLIDAVTKFYVEIQSFEESIASIHSASSGGNLNMTNRSSRTTNTTANLMLTYQPSETDRLLKKEGFPTGVSGSDSKYMSTQPEGQQADSVYGLPPVIRVIRWNQLAQECLRRGDHSAADTHLSNAFNEIPIAEKSLREKEGVNKTQSEATHPQSPSSSVAMTRPPAATSHLGVEPSIVSLAKPKKMPPKSTANPPIDAKNTTPLPQQDTGEQLQERYQWEEKERQIDNTVRQLSAMTLNNMACYARATKQLRVALRYLQKLMEFEEQLAKHSVPKTPPPTPTMTVTPNTTLDSTTVREGNVSSSPTTPQPSSTGPHPLGNSVSTLLNVAAVLTQLEESEEALLYIRQAENLLCSQAIEELGSLLTAKKKFEMLVNKEEGDGWQTDPPQFQQRDVHVELKYPNLLGLSVTALHNAAMAQAVCPLLVDRSGSSGLSKGGITSGKDLAVANEKLSCRTTHQYAYHLGCMVLGEVHPLTRSVEATSVRIAEVLAASHLPKPTI